MKTTRYGTGIGRHATLTALATLALAVAAIWGCGSDDSPTGPAGLDTPEAYTERGWERFTDDDFGGAMNDFDAALDLEAQHGPALAGRAWTLLVQAASPTAMQAALTAFETAIVAGENGAYVLAGKASARLGTSIWSSVVTDAQAALTTAPGLVFEHRPSFTSVDLFLIIAIAEAAAGDMDGALTAADVIADSGINAAVPSTWTVIGITYDTFAGAVLARLQELSDAHAG